MTTTTEDINPPRCQVQGCTDPQRRTSTVPVEVDGLTILVTLCQAHKEARARARGKS